MDEDTPEIDAEEMDVEDTTAMRQQRVDQRLHELLSQLDVNGRINGALARVAGVDSAELPDDVLAEIETIRERTFNAGPPPLGTAEDDPVPTD